MTRTLTQRQELFRRLGVDLGLTYAGPGGRHQDADLATTSALQGLALEDDAETVSDVAAARQLLVNRLMTAKGELARLGHPTYGSRHHEMIGQPNNERTRNLIKLHVLECLRHEPRVAKVLGCEVTTYDFEPDVVRIVLDLRLIDQPEPLNLVVPFELAGGA